MATMAPTRTATTRGLTAITSGLFLAEVAVNTWLSRDYLHRHGWGLRDGDNVPWPSMLALGPHGWAQMLGFAVAGMGLLAMVPVLRASLPQRRGRRASLTLVTLFGLAVMLSSARLDPSMVTQQPATTWHGQIHGLMFILALPTALLAPIAVALTTKGEAAWRSVSRYSAVQPALLIAALVSGQNNLSFFLFLTLVFTWMSTVAWIAGTLPPAMPGGFDRGVTADAAMQSRD